MSSESEYAARVAARATSQVGYNPGRTGAKYAEWYGSPKALWCVCGGTWCDYAELGAAAGRAICGVQAHAPNGRGFAWTVAHRQWLAKNGTKVPLKNAQPGDYLFFKYPTADDRNKNPVNHEDRVVGAATSSHIPTVGFNTPRPGSGGDPSNGRGVWRHNRALSDRYIVDCYRPPWWRHPDLIGYVQKSLTELGYAPGPVDGAWGARIKAAVRAFQSATGLSVDSIPGPATRASIALALVREAVNEGDLTMSDVKLILDALARLPREVADAVLATKPVASKGARQQRFRNHDVSSQLLYAADGGLKGNALLAQVMATQEVQAAAITELAASVGNSDQEVLGEKMATAAQDAAVKITALLTAAPEDEP